MKELFPGFFRRDLDYEKIWQSALFVFDTNVLLNMYRYQPTTRNELLGILGKIAGRIWIPHVVAVEFLRTRVNVIAEQNNKFGDVRQIVSSSQQALKNKLGELHLRDRHSSIDPDKLLQKIDEAIQEFFVELDEKKEAVIKPIGPDPILETIASLFENRIGQTPKDQAELEKLYQEAERRFKLEIPPGFRDADKSASAYLNKNIIYQPKYGDFLIWHQLLEQAKSTGVSSVVFVTNDQKEDWWWIVNCGGEKRLGPRPELVEEAKIRGGIEKLLMYTPEQFLKSARSSLQTQISDTTLEEVRDISRADAAIERRLFRQSVLTDVLTGLPNRCFLQEQLQKNLERSQSLRAPLSIVLVDLDDFKAINQQWGYQIGDEVLKQVARLLQVGVPPNGFVARQGGDEFAILLPNFESSAAADFADLLRLEFERNKMPVASRPVHVTSSFGVAEHRASEGDVDAAMTTLIHRADSALYESKRKGKNRVTVAP